jgi:glucose-1-phosphate adenylyltransferase
MGIYIFNWKVLREHLIQDAEDETSSFDFGKNIIPNTLLDGLDVFAYKFKGYWKDVGTIQSLWEANMDLLEEDPPFDLYDPNWKIYSVNPNQTPQFIGKDACVEQSVINEGCQIEGEVQHSVLFYDVRVGEGSLVKDSVIMPGARIGKDVTIHRAIVASCAVIQDGATVGEPGGEIVVIEPHENIESGTVFKQRV